MKCWCMTINKADNPYIVFDLDDTLFQEVDYLKSAYKEIANLVSPNNPDYVYSEMFERYKAGENVFAWLIIQYGSEVEDLTVQKLIKLYREHYPEITLAEDVHDFITRLNSSSIPFGLITDGRSMTQRNKLKALGIEGMFSDLVISEEFGSEKPDERNYLYYVDKHPGNHFYYIGDNTGKDFIVPAKLGWTTVCIRDRGLNIHQQDLHRSPVPNHIVSTFKEIEIA
jgi:putative hydrolase of the HAD superfamily